MDESYMHVIFRTVKAKAETMTVCVLGVAVVLQVSNPRNGHNKICFVSSNTADLLNLSQAPCFIFIQFEEFYPH